MGGTVAGCCCVWRRFWRVCSDESRNTMWWCEVDVKMKMEGDGAGNEALETLPLLVVSGLRSPPNPPSEQAMSLRAHQLELKLSSHVIVHCTTRTLLHCVSSVLHQSVTRPMAISFHGVYMSFTCIQKIRHPSTERLCTLFSVAVLFDIGT